MNGSIEQLVRDAGERTVPPFDVGAVRDRARGRRRHRRARRGVALLVSVALAATAVALVASSSGDTARRVDTTRSLPTFTRTPGIPDAYGVGSIATDGHAYVATGLANDPTATPLSPVTHAAIWYSTDGRTWRVVYSEAPQPAVPADPRTPPPPTVQAANISSAVATAQGFVAWGSRGLAGLDGPVAAVWTSQDGVTWTRVDDPAFLPVSNAKPAYGGVSMSEIDDIIEHDGELLGVGSIYTHSEAPAGGQPCIWTSPDGVHWTHQIVDLGPGFDPYFDALALRGGLVVTTGRVGKYPAISWTSRDLTHWKRTTIAPQAGASLVDTAQGLFAIGSLRHSASPRDEKTRPAIWRSPDGHRWQRVLTLPTGTLTHFTALAGDGSRLLALGTTDDGKLRIPRPFVYTSTDGAHWLRVRLPLDVFPRYTTFATVTVINGRLTIAGSVASNGGPIATSTSYFWTATG